MSQQGSGAPTDLTSCRVGQVVAGRRLRTVRDGHVRLGLQFDANLAALRDRGALTAAVGVLSRWSEAATDDAAAEDMITHHLQGGRTARRTRTSRLHRPVGKERQRSSNRPTSPAVRRARSRQRRDAGKDGSYGRWPSVTRTSQAQRLGPTSTRSRAGWRRRVDAAWQRQHLYTDLPAHWGSSETLHPIAARDWGPPIPEWEAAESVSCVVMTIRREVVGRSWHGPVRDPSLSAGDSRSTQSAAEFPDLCHFFGGYFGHEFSDETGWPTEP